MFWRFQTVFKFPLPGCGHEHINTPIGVSERIMMAKWKRHFPLIWVCLRANSS